MATHGEKNVNLVFCWMLRKVIFGVTDLSTFSTNVFQPQTSTNTVTIVSIRYKYFLFSFLLKSAS